MRVCKQRTMVRMKNGTKCVGNQEMESKLMEVRSRLIALTNDAKQVKDRMERVQVQMGLLQSQMNVIERAVLDTKNEIDDLCALNSTLYTATSTTDEMPNSCSAPSADDAIVPLQNGLVNGRSKRTKKRKTFFNPPEQRKPRRQTKASARQRSAVSTGEYVEEEVIEQTVHQQIEIRRPVCGRIVDPSLQALFRKHKIKESKVVLKQLKGAIDMKRLLMSS